MKIFVVISSVIAVILIFLFCPLSTKENVEYLRIHIRANSNCEADQNVKYKVKDGVVEAMIPILAQVKTFEEAKLVIGENFAYIEKVANDILRENGFEYKSHASIKREYFPTRTYENITLEEGDYDALILELGSGTGNNWWCIVFPAFCFTKTQNFDNIEYISIIWEIIRSVKRG